MSFCAMPVVNAAEIPDAVIPAGVGVNIHFCGAGHERDLDMIAAAGFKFIRMDFHWEATERKKGEYDWRNYEILTDELDKRGIRALYILDYSNRLYEDMVEYEHPRRGKEKAVVAPRKPESRAAFARWAGEAARHFKGRHILWEIWNEPNISFWKPEPKVEDYAALALEACKAIRAADPQATLLAPASSGFPWEFFEGMFKVGLLEYLDAVSVHPYRSKPPETAVADYARLRGLIARYAPPGKENMTILSGEWGYSTQDKGLTREMQGAYIVRQQLSNLLNDVPLSIWYDWHDDGKDVSYNEHNFGTVTYDYQPKPSYLAVQEMTRELNGYRVAKRLSTDSPEDYVLLMQNAAGEQKLAAWTIGGETPRKITVEGMPLEIAAAPKYVSVKTTPSFALQGAWCARSVPSPLIMAGAQDGIRVAVEVVNPLVQDLSAEFRATTPECVSGAWEGASFLDGLFHAGRKVKLAPRETAKIEWRGTLNRQDVEDVPVRLEARFQSPQGQTTSTETVPLIVGNTLRLRMAPARDGIYIDVLNPFGRPFTGAVTVGFSTETMTLAGGETWKSVRLPCAPGEVCLRNASGQKVATLPPPRFVPVPISKFRTALDGDSKIGGKAEVATMEAPGPNAPYPEAFRLSYDFEPGWKFVRLVPDGSDPIPIEGRPAAFGMWVCGDGSKNLLRCRFVDSTGQTFQPRGEAISWTGWRWVELPIRDTATSGHWGGANDGTIHWPVRWDSPILVDGHRLKTASVLFFAGLTLVGTRDE